MIERYLVYLHEQERSAHTIRKYAHDLNALYTYLDNVPLTKEALIEWKSRLADAFAPASVNSIPVAINGFLSFCGWSELRIKLLKLQKSVFLDETKELTREDYTWLVNAAKARGNERLMLVIQTLCSTGIRVSELRFITAESVRIGRAEISNKGKRRIVFLPTALRKLLTTYLRNRNKRSGPVFTTRSGRPLDRSNIWRDMKALCQYARVSPQKKSFLIICGIFLSGCSTSSTMTFPGWLTSSVIPASTRPASTRQSVALSMHIGWNDSV